MSVWKVNTVVVAPDRALSTRELGRDPVYAAAFMTAALGRQPTLEAGAWVWNHVQLGLTRALVLKAGTLATCTAAAEGKAGLFHADHAAGPVRRRGCSGGIVRAVDAILKAGPGPADDE